MAEQPQGADAIALLRTAATRFWSYVDRTAGPSSCWPWTRGRDKDGYGKFATGPHGGQKHWRAHRAVLVLEGRDPGEVTMHECDNRACCNPAHLRAGTQAENSEDCTAKGRNATGDRNGARTCPDRRPRGERHPNAVLTYNLVSEIRRLRNTGLGARRIAKKLSVSAAAVHPVLSGKTWKDTP